MPDVTRSVLIFALMAFTILPNLSLAQEGTQPLPVVTAASVPFYPPIARQAHIEGEVRLEVSTDYDHVSNVSILSGQIMLAQAAKANVSTWHFGPDIRMKFEVTFHYRLLSVPEKRRCESVNANSNVSLKLPTEVEITADELWTCDPSSTIHKNR